MSAALTVCLLGGIAEDKRAPANFDAHSIAMRKPPAAVAPTRPGDADGGSAKRRANRHRCALAARGLRQLTL
jgi:hypothetical protein